MPRRATQDRLARRLDDVTSRSAAALVPVLASLKPTTHELDALIAMASSSNAPHAIGATWLLKALLEKGANLSPTQTAALGRGLDKITNEWAALHICQSLSLLTIPARNAGQFARLLDRSIAGEQKFLRAWAIDGYWQLTQMHDKYLPRALEVISRGADDPAASVRARVRRIQRELQQR